MREGDTMKYLYGMRLRGVAPGAQPKGIVEFYPPSVQYKQYWNVIVYDRQLTDKEVQNYDLDYLGVTE